MIVTTNRSTVYELQGITQTKGIHCKLNGLTFCEHYATWFGTAKAILLHCKGYSTTLM